MPTAHEARLDAAFAALADPTRRAILARLAQGETHVGDLAGPFVISGPAVSRHLRVLEGAGLIERQVNARWRICRLRPEGLQSAHGWLDQYRRYWEDSLDRLVGLFETPPPPPPAKRRPTTERAVKAPQRKRR
jgi:DNA-binding transcriptional ArsR family regulator